MKRALLLSLLLLVQGVALAEAYRIVHPDGTVEFTDEPVEGAEPLELAPPSTYTFTPPAAPAVPPPTAEPQAQPPAEAPVKYKKVEVVSPADDSTVIANDNRMQVAVLVEPQLRADHQVVLLMDGTARAKGGGVFTLNEVYRGTHTLQAKVVDAQDKVLATSPTTRVHVQHHFRRQGEADPLNGLPVKPAAVEKLKLPAGPHATF